MTTTRTHPLDSALTDLLAQRDRDNALNTRLDCALESKLRALGITS